MDKITTLLNTFRLIFLLYFRLFFKCSTPSKEPRKKAKKIAFFTAFLPPFESGGVHRLIPLIKAIEHDGFDCKYYTRQHPRNDNLSDSEEFMLSLLPDSADITAKSNLDFKCIFALLPNIDGGIQAAAAAYYHAINDEHQPDIVFASGPSFNFVIAAYLYAVKKGLPLVVDYRDEWTDCPFDFVQKSTLSRKFEQLISDYASKIIMTTDEMVDMHQASFAQSSDKYQVIHNGWDEDLSSQLSSEKVQHDTITRLESLKRERTLLLYVGGLGVATPPFDFLNYLLDNASQAEIESLSLAFIGHVEKSYLPDLDNLKERIDLHIFPPVPKSVAVSSLGIADFLLLFTNQDMQRYLPGKLFDYLKSGTQIIIYGCNGAAATIVTELGAGIFIDETTALPFSKVIEQKHMIQSDTALTWLSEHRRSILSKRILDVIVSAP